MVCVSGIYTDPYLVRMQYATYTPIWEERISDRICRIDRIAFRCRE